mmetsp:Transcript_4009/g.12033  ORF Transcript_4009/g.12033 Transcript_4009/m.12033 type:complete len:603 (+) Transcript_4009:284-2092(+)
MSHAEVRRQEITNGEDEEQVFSQMSLRSSMYNRLEKLDNADTSTSKIKRRKSTQSFSARAEKKSMSDMWANLQAKTRSLKPEFSRSENKGPTAEKSRLDSSLSDEAPVMLKVRSKSFTELYHMKRKDAFDDSSDSMSPQRPSIRRAASHPVRSSTSIDYNPIDQHKRVNYLMLSRPVKVPEPPNEAEEDDRFEKLDRVFTKRVVQAVGKQLHKERKKKKIKDGVVVYKGHPSWSIVLAFQVGLRHTSELLSSQQCPPELAGADNNVDVVFELRAAVPAQNHTAATNTSWGHHAPVLYKQIRERFGISDRIFIESVAAESKIRELPTPGKSGALFYVTEDEEYFIKTITKVEEEKLKEMLPDYYKHVVKFPETLLTKFLANFYMRTHQGGHIRLVAMGSIFRSGLYIDQKYDLKGSVINRKATEEEKKKDFVTLKDLDLDTVFFEPKVLEQLFATLEEDTRFLEEKGIMDYSLLMGFSEVLPGEKIHEDIYGEGERFAPWLFGYQMDSSQKMRVYRISLGIIDILQSFTLRKRAEYFSKTLRYCASDSVSVNPPSRYRRRFIAYMRDRFWPLTVTPPPLVEVAGAFGKMDGQVDMEAELVNSM